ncbi:MAG: PAS domain S-box protein [Candidatus Methanoperedens sp.]|nr:PAS domain S-box protein [Candidatus Methanoperedens sp.]MCE8427017.1 PAS domain S-box protein [Candidatus Methanoperedens sp.]
MKHITRSRRTEKAIRGSEENYRRLLDHANDAVVTTDIRGFVTSWNKSAEKLFGWTAEEITGKRMVEMLATQETAAEKEKMICEILPDTISGHEISCMRRDGTEIYVSITISPLVDENQNIAGRSLIIRDITEHKRQDEALRKSEEFSRTVLNSMNDAIMVIDVGDFSIVGANGLFLEKFGMKEDEVIGKKCYEISHKITEPCYLKNEICPLIESVEKGTYSSVEHVHFGKNGNKIYVEVSTSPIKDNTGKVVQVIHVARDITERKRMDELLRQSEEKYRTLYDSSSDAIMLLDEKGFFDCNNATLRMFGFSKTEDFTVHPSDVSPPYQPDGVDSPTAANNKIAEAFKTGTNYFEWVHRRQNGEDFSADVLMTAFNFKGKRVLQATVRDTTERKKLEAFRLENERLALANEAKSEFLMIMSHELRTPLNAILGFSELLKQKGAGELNKKQEGYIVNVISGGKHLLEIINEILDLTKIEAGKVKMHVEKISAHDAIDDNLELIRKDAMRRNVTLEKEIDPSLEFIEADRKMLSQILFNLLSNAVKFSRDEGGKVTVKAKRIDDAAQFSISDTGMGIKEEDMNKLFRAFQQIDMSISRKYGGTGLGLIITKKLVELHGGRIWAESKYGEGSTFRFTLPLEKDLE